MATTLNSRDTHVYRKSSSPQVLISVSAIYCSVVSEFRLGIYCFKCSQFSFCECPNEIAISGEKGLIEYDEDCIGFGGNMEPDTLQDRDKCISVWRSICQRKIKEAYDEYISAFKEH